jgi:phosphopantothenoylcysteine decarboxylase / phosphopantothenate---cysteine ligase
MSLSGKRIVLGVSGSIAAYKAVVLTRLLVRAGAEVRVLMTPAATEFVTPLTFSTLSKAEVLTSVSSEAGWHNHVELGLWADALVVAPATANTLARLANGICDNIITAVYLSARCPVFFAPAMDVDMWHHPSTQANVTRLQSFGNVLIPVESGELASGLSGAGRLAEPEHIAARLEQYFDRNQDLKGRKLLVTAGPTYEALDPVRYLGNHSTGKMGIAIAEAAAQRGAEVLLLLGPSREPVRASGITLVRVQSAREMHAAAVAAWPERDGAILAAAVSDYRPARVAPEKIKKGEEARQLELVRNPDIAAELGQSKHAAQVLVGFAMETEQARENARRKLVRKNLDFIVVNSLRESGAGFGHDTNKITILDHNKEQEFELKSKTAVADDILDEMVVRWKAR